VALLFCIAQHLKHDSSFVALHACTFASLFSLMLYGLKIITVAEVATKA
jgi:hypothetical protein